MILEYMGYRWYGDRWKVIRALLGAMCCLSEWNGISRIIMVIDIVFRKRKDRLTTSTPIRNTSVREQGGRLLKSDGIMYTTSVN